VREARDESASEVEDQKAKAADAAFERRPENEQRPHIKEDMPPAAMQKSSGYKRKVVIRIETVQVRPNRVEIALRHKPVLL
jgi:hypothetical protein